MPFKIFTVLAVIAVLLLAIPAAAQDDPLGKTDTVTLKFQQIGDKSWMVTASLWNDEEIAAIDIPIKYTAGIARLKVDSVSFAGTRCEGFEQKYSQVDTTSQMMHFGGFAYMSPNKPPLASGSGEIGRVFISAYGDKKVGVFAVDTATVPPNSKLMIVDRNALSIIPALKIEEVKATVEAKPKKK